MTIPTMGLAKQDVAARLRSDGPRELQLRSRAEISHLVLAVLWEPMLLMHVVVGVLCVLMGEPIDATLRMASVFVIIGITIV
jgi:magnesium-transporting ATPase (P-type)